MSSKEIFQNRVAVLPAFGVPNNIYYVPNGNGTDLDEYVADNNGQFRRVRSLSPINVSAGATSADLTAITFSNSNNVSFGLSNGVMTASVAGGGGAITDYISIGQSSLFQLTADNSLSLGTTYTTHTHSQYVNTSQSSLFLTNQTVQPVAASGSNGSFLFSTISFGNLNGLSFYTTNGSIVGSYTDGGGGGGDGYNILAAGTQTANASTTVILSNANNVSFGMAGNSVITASASYSNPTDYISTAQSSLFQLTANMTDYLDTSYTTHTHDYVENANSSLFQLTADNSLSLGTGYTTHTHSQYLNTSQSSLFEQSSHTTVFLTNQSNQAYSAGNGSDTFQTLSFADSNGVSFSTGTQGIYATVKTDYQSSGAYLTTAMLSNAGSRFVNTSAGLNLTNISATLDSNSVSLSVAAQSVQPVAASASNGSFAFSTLKFVETNGVTWATSTDGIRASVKTDYQSSGAYLTTAMASNRGSDFVQATAAFAGTNATGTIASDGISVSVNAQSSVPQNASLYALGNTTQNSSTVLSLNALSFNGLGAATVGYSNGSIQVSVPTQTVDTGKAGTGFTSAGNNIGLSGTLNTNGLSLSATVAAQSNQNISLYGLGNTTQNSSTVLNASNLSFNAIGSLTVGYSNGSIQLSAANALTSQSAQAFSADASSTFQTLSFQDSNGVSFSNNAGALRITHGLQFTSNTSAITSDAVHTSAARIQGIIGSNTTYTSGSVGLRDLNGITWQSTTGQSFQITHDLQYTSNTSAITSNAFATSASSRFVQNWKLTGNTAGTTSSSQGSDLWLAGGNNITISGSSNTISFSIDNYLTTARASTDAIGLNTAQSNVTWTANSGGLSLDGRGYAGTGTTFNGTNASASITQNSNGLRLDLSILPSLGGGVGISAGTQSASSGTVVFSNSNNVSFGMSNSSVITASFNPINIGISTNGNTAGTTGTFDGGNLQYILIGGNNITLSQSSNGSSVSLSIHGNSNPAFSAANASSTYLTLTLQDSNGISFSNNAGALRLTHALQYTSATSAITSNAAGTGFTSAGANISFSGTLNSNGLSLSGSVAPPGAAAENNWVNLLGANTAGNTSASGSTIGWSGGNNITLSATNGSQIVISAANQTNQTVGLYALGNTTQNSSTTLDARTMSLNGLGAMTVGYSNGSIQMSAPATSSLSGTGQVSISVNGSTISIGVPNASTYSIYNPYADLPLVAGQVGQGTLNINPDVFPNFTCDRVLMPINNTNSSNSSGSHTLSFWLGVYTLNASTLSLLTSQSMSTALTHSGTAGSYSLYSGMRHISMGLSTSFSEGRYFIGVLSRTTSGGANGSYSQFQISNINSNFMGHFGSSHNTTYQYQLGQGVYTVTTSAMPASIAISQIRGSDSMGFRSPAILFANGTI